MIYLEPSTLTWRPLLTSYLNREFYPALADFSKEFEAFFCFLAHACIYHVRHESKELVFTGDSNLVKSMICWVSMLMHKHCEDQQEAAANKHLKGWLLNATVFACIWSVGATSDTDSRLKFDAFMRELLKGKLNEYPYPDLVNKTDINFPDNGLVYDYFFDVCLFSVFNLLLNLI
jgi:dynein heavy chain, axonemal